MFQIPRTLTPTLSRSTERGRKVGAPPRTRCGRAKGAVMDTEREVAPVRSWLASPMETSAARAIERVRRADDVAYVAVLPDVHLAGDVCVGTATATRRVVY